MCVNNRCVPLEVRRFHWPPTFLLWGGPLRSGCVAQHQEQPQGGSGSFWLELSQSARSRNDPASFLTRPFCKEQGRWAAGGPSAPVGSLWCLVEMEGVSEPQCPVLHVCSPRARKPSHPAIMMAEISFWKWRFLCAMFFCPEQLGKFFRWAGLFCIPLANSQPLSIPVPRKKIIDNNGFFFFKWISEEVFL